MTAQYSETVTTGGDVRDDVLHTFAKGRPYVFIVATSDDDGNVTLGIETGGGVRDSRDVRNILELALRVLPSRSAANREANER